jgi:hypothetical protein
VAGVTLKGPLFVALGVPASPASTRRFAILCEHRDLVSSGIPRFTCPMLPVSGDRSAAVAAGGGSRSRALGVMLLAVDLAEGGGCGGNIENGPEAPPNLLPSLVGVGESHVPFCGSETCLNQIPGCSRDGGVCVTRTVCSFFSCCLVNNAPLAHIPCRLFILNKASMHQGVVHNAARLTAVSECFIQAAFGGCT